jgi:hypothetical protein
VKNHDFTPKKFSGDRHWLHMQVQKYHTTTTTMKGNISNLHIVRKYISAVNAYHH